jgi:hypothetical protein
MDNRVENKHIHGCRIMSCLRKIFGPGIATVLAVSLAAQTEDMLIAHADFDYASNYQFRGVERAGPSVQAGMDLESGRFSGAVWTNQPLARDQVRESNLNAAYRWSMPAAVSLTASLGNSWFGGVPGGGVSQSLETGLAATFANFKGFSPGVSYFHDFRFRSDTTQATLVRSIALTSLGAFLEIRAYLGWVSGKDWRPDEAGPARVDGYGYWGGEIRLPYRIGMHSTAVAGVRYAENVARSASNGPFGLADRQTVGFTVGVNLDF